MRNEQQRLTLFNAELGHGCSIAESGWGVVIRATPAKLRSHGNTPRLQALVGRPATHAVFWAVHEPEARLDISVTSTDDGKAWTLTDLLGRPMGRITEAPAQQFTIHPEGHARETMAGIAQGPFASLDAALAAIEKHTRGVCRHHPGEDQP
jgi:hypothetical protein